MTSGAADAHSTPSRRTMLAWICGAGAVVATPASVMAFLAKADTAATAAAASGWTTFDAFVHDLGLTFSASAAEQLVKKGVTTVRSSLQTTKPVAYRVGSHAAIHKSTGSVAFPVTPDADQPQLSRLVYIMTPAGHLIAFLPRATQSLAKVSAQLQQRHNLTAEAASEYLMPVTAAHDLGNPPSNQAIRFGTLHGPVQMFNRPTPTGSKEVVTITALSESWEYAVAPGSVDLT